MSTKANLTAPVNLKAWRAGRNMNQRQAARFLGITQGYYSKLENGQLAPRRNIARRLTEKTGVPLASIMGMAS